MKQATVEKNNIVKHKASSAYLVIRLGNVYNVSSRAYHIEDPIYEIDKVIKKHKACFFAKFGKPINIKKLSKYSSNFNFKLVVCYKRENNYITKTYQITSTHRILNPNIKNYPEYYIGKEDLVGTWFEITQSEDQVDIKNLMVSSSYQKLLPAMSGSMSSFFFCKKGISS
jgi:hypothetical protein